MKRTTKIILGVGLALLCAIGGVVIWQGENMVAVWEATQYSEDELGEQLQETKEQVDEALTQYHLEGYRDFTLEEENAIRSGELTVEEALARIIPKTQEAQQGADNQGQAENNQVAVSQETSEGDQTASTDPKAKVDQVVAEYVTQMYGLKGKYIGLLGGLEGRAKSAFFGLPESERNVQGLQKIAPPFISEAVGLESQCNGEVAQLLGSMETELKELGVDTAIVDTMRKSYESEKRLRKAYYLSAFK